MRAPETYVPSVRNLQRHATTLGFTELAGELEAVGDEFEVASRQASDAHLKLWQLLQWARDAGIPGAGQMLVDMRRNDVT